MVLVLREKTNGLIKMKKRIKSVIGRVIFSSQLHRLLFTNTAVVVAFHRVNDSTAGDGLTCRVDMFERYCKFFERFFHVVSLRYLIERMECHAPISRMLAVTFDDGYRDNYENAAPILSRLGLPATFFVATRFIGTDHVPWWDQGLAVPQPWMTWDHVRSLSRSGFDIGAHTQTHVDLGVVSGRRAREEILESRLELEAELSKTVDLFAYPYGRENQMTDENREIVKAADLRCCCSCFGGINPSGTDPFFLRRIPIASWWVSPHHFGCDAALHRI